MAVRNLSTVLLGGLLLISCSGASTRKLVQLGGLSLGSNQLVVTLGGALCTKGPNVAGSMLVQCLSLDASITQTTCVKMCQSGEDQCAPCENIDQVCRKATSRNELEFRGTPQGYYQDSGCAILGSRTVPPTNSSSAPAPAPSTSSLSVSSADVLGGAGTVGNLMFGTGAKAETP